MESLQLMFLPMSLYVYGKRKTGKTAAVVDLFKSQCATGGVCFGAGVLLFSSISSTLVKDEYGELLTCVYPNKPKWVGSEMLIHSAFERDMWDVVVGFQEERVASYGHSEQSSLLIIFDELAGIRENKLIRLFLTRAKDLNISVVVVECVEDMRETDETRDFKLLFRHVIECDEW